MNYHLDDTTPIMFLMIDSTDHLTGKTGLSPTVTFSKAGGAFGASTNSATEVSSGWYQIIPTSTESNTLGAFVIHATAAGADDHDTLLQITNDLSGATYSNTTDSQEAIRDAITAVAAKTDLLGTGVVTFSGPVISSDEVEIVQGDDYLNIDSQALEFTATSWPDLSGASAAKFSFRLAGDPSDAATTIDGTVVDDETVRFELTAAQTGALVTGTDVYSFDSQVTLASGSIKTLSDPEGSRMTVKKQITT